MNPLDNLTRAGFDRANRAAAEADSPNGVFGEVLVAEAFDVRHQPDAADWYDCVHDERGTKYEVKTTQTQIDGSDPDRRVPVGGRFRLWKGQTRSLLSAASADGQTAWIVFVLLDADGNPIAMRRVTPSTVWAWVRDEYDGWDESGHDSMGEQQKIPADFVFPSV
jgi:hypothetical protein